MSEPWFDPNRYAWIPGTALGVFGGLWGALAGINAPRGKAKALVLGGWFALLGISAVLLVAGIAAYASGQPYGVWYGLGLAGLIGALVIGLNTPMILRRYREADARRLEAHNL